MALKQRDTAAALSNLASAAANEPALLQDRLLEVEKAKTQPTDIRTYVSTMEQGKKRNVSTVFSSLAAMRVDRVFKTLSDGRLSGIHRVNIDAFAGAQDVASAAAGSAAGSAAAGPVDAAGNAFLGKKL